MVRADDEHWLDEAAGRLVRPYTVSNGRTQPSTRMELLSMVMATGSTSYRAVSSARITWAADTHDTSCSADCPP